jgi:bifunctional UDP-N-acetylglucosamine pyrophosphorylase/glucosamine-1-phosphate N-acetyltransferase
MNKALDFQAIILAAGRGSRMGSDLPKVLLPVCGQPMLQIILDVLKEAGIPKPVTVVGKGAEAVKDVLGDRAIYAVQEEPQGSGHAVMCAREAAQGAANIVIMCGDSPLFRTSTVRDLMETHLSSKATISLACAVLDNPFGYGRIVRNPDGSVSGVVEEKLATEEQKKIKEINGGCYAFDAEWLWTNIDILPRNDVGEYCLTEMVDIAISQGKKVITVSAGADEVLGINTPEQLAEAEAVLKARA